MSSKLFAAVNSILEAKCGDVATSRYKMTFKTRNTYVCITFTLLYSLTHQGRIEKNHNYLCSLSITCSKCIFGFSKGSTSERRLSKSFSRFTSISRVLEGREQMIRIYTKNQYINTATAAAVGQREDSEHQVWSSVPVVARVFSLF